MSDATTETKSARAANHFSPGTMVEVVRPISAVERKLLGRTFAVVRMDKTHGYCVVSDNAGGGWHLHPEALSAAGAR